MDTAVYLEHLDRETRSFAEAIDAKLEHDVPSCPGWNVRTLAHHIWGFLLFWPYVVEHDVRDLSQMNAERPEPPGDEELAGEILKAKDHAIDVLRGADPSAPIWNWSKNKTISFIHRRMPNELSIHRWDAQNAGGDAAPIPVELAADGVDEFFNVFVASGWMRLHSDHAGSGEAVKFEPTDASGSWVVRLVGNAGEVGADGTEAGTIARGTASDLILMLWRRIGTGPITIEGDREPLDRFLSWEQPG